MKGSNGYIEVASFIYEKMKTIPIGTEISVSEVGELALEDHPDENGLI